MKNTPLQVKLRKESHRRIAYLQDLIMKEVYSVFNDAVLHGGTAIWRCYGGKRFSEDIDLYLSKNKKKILLLFENLKKLGFDIKKKKISETSVYSELVMNRTSVRLEATFQKCRPLLCDYELVDGNFITIYSLLPEDFIVEKTNTYLKRFKIRDLWDIFFLLKEIHDFSKIKKVEKIINNYKKPLDEEDLKVILLEGIIPSSDQMIEYIKRKWQNKYI